MLVRGEINELQVVPDGQVGQLGGRGIFLFVAALDVDRLVAVEDPLAGTGVEEIAAGLHVNADLVEHGRRHLAGDGPPPDELVQASVVRLEGAHD